MRGFVVVVWFDCIFVGGRFVVGVLCFFIVGFVFFRDLFRETGERGSVEVCDLLDLEGVEREGVRKRRWVGGGDMVC